MAELRKNATTGSFWLDFPTFNIGFQQGQTFPNIHYTAKPGETITVKTALFLYDKPTHSLEVFLPLDVREGAA
jgi:hypothetical protein